MSRSLLAQRSPRTDRREPAGAGLRPGKGFRRRAYAAAAAAVAAATLSLTGGAAIAAGTASGSQARVVTVYVASQGSNTVTPISAATNKPGRPIPLPPGGYTTAMAITPDGKTVYVGDSTPDPELGYVTPISTATNKALPAIQIVGSPGQIAFTPDGRTGYVTTGSNTVIPFSTATNKAGRDIRVGNLPMFVVIAP
jgi:hyaluronoglucosaminidase